MIMLAHGVTVALACAPVNEGPEAILEFGVIDENDDYIVIAKPAPLIVHPSNGRDEPTLLCGLEELLAFEVANGKSRRSSPGWIAKPVGSFSSPSTLMPRGTWR